MLSNIGLQRPLSPLERDAVDLVFRGSIDLSKISVTVVKFFEPPPLWAAAKLPQVASTHDGDGNIKIRQSAFPHTKGIQIHGATTRGAKAQIFKPANMHYLSTLIHECTHYWQGFYGRHGPAVSHANAPPQPADYEFDSKQLKERDVPALSSEQHAAAVQVYFLIAWQLRYLVEDSLVNLTSRSENSELDVGPVHRFLDIDNLANTQNTDCPRIITYENARNLIDVNFGWLLVELRYGWKAVCEGKAPFAKATGG